MAFKSTYAQEIYHIAILL